SKRDWSSDVCSSDLHLVQIIENDDADEDMRAYAADAVGDLGQAGLPTLTELAEGPDLTIRMMAIEAIPRAGRAGESAIPMLAKEIGRARVGKEDRDR